MPNPATPVVPIQLDRLRHFKYGFNALVRYEQATGENLMRLKPGEALEFDTLAKLRAVIWAGLAHEDPALTLDDVGDLLDEIQRQRRLEEVMGLFGQAVQLAVGGQEQAQNGNGTHPEGNPEASRETVIAPPSLSTG